MKEHQIVRITGDGTFRRFGKAWSTKPTLVAVVEEDAFKDPGDRPLPPDGCGWAISKGELSLLRREMRGDKFPLTIEEPDEFDCELRQTLADLAQATRQRETEERELQRVRIERERADAELADLRGNAATLERKLAEAEDRARRAEQAAEAAEQRLVEANARAQEMADARAPKKKGG
jgi:hypothetical protein